MCVCLRVVCPTHCIMQGKGMNFLHLADTFGLWVTLACRRHSENQMRGTVKHHNVLIFSAILKISYHVLHINYTAHPSQTMCND